MRKTKNALSIISIILVVLGATVLMLFPVFHDLFKPETASDKLFPLFDILIPTELFNFKAIVDLFAASNFVELLSYANLFRLITWLVLLILAIFFIIWFIKIIVKKKPVELIWWLLLLVVIAAAVEVLNIAFLTGFTVSTENPKTFTYKEGVAGGISESLVVYLFSLALTSPAGTYATVINPTTCWIELAGFACAAIGLVLAIVAVALQIAWLKKIKNLKPAEDEAVEEQKEEIEETVEEPLKEESTREEPVAEVVPTQAVFEPVVEEEPGVNNYKVVRRILVHKSGKVIRILNEHFYDVTTDIYIEPGFEEPFDPNETEKAHYEKLIKMNQETPAVPSKPVAQPAPVVKEPEVENPEYERISFEERIKKADSTLKGLYNELKSEIMSYGVKSRVSAGGDMFRLHTKTYVKMTIAGKSIKLYLALDPKAYANTTIPFDDASKKNLYKEIPFVFKVKSPLSLRRAKQLIADTMLKDNLVQGKVEKRNWIKEL